MQCMQEESEGIVKRHTQDLTPKADYMETEVVAVMVVVLAFG